MFLKQAYGALEASSTVFIWIYKHNYWFEMTDKGNDWISDMMRVINPSIFRVWGGYANDLLFHVNPNVTGVSDRGQILTIMEFN